MASVYHDLNIKTQAVEYTSGFIFGDDVQVPAGLESWSLPQTETLRVDHQGSYSHLGNGWSAANQISRYKKMKRSKVGDFEIYKNNPEHTPAGELMTEIYLPLKS